MRCGSIGGIVEPVLDGVRRDDAKEPAMMALVSESKSRLFLDGCWGGRWDHRVGDGVLRPTSLAVGDGNRCGGGELYVGEVGAETKTSCGESVSDVLAKSNSLVFIRPSPFFSEPALLTTLVLPRGLGGVGGCGCDFLARGESRFSGSPGDSSCGEGRLMVLEC